MRAILDVIGSMMIGCTAVARKCNSVSYLQSVGWLCSNGFLFKMYGHMVEMSYNLYL